MQAKRAITLSRCDDRFPVLHVLPGGGSLKVYKETLKRCVWKLSRTSPEL